MKFTVFSRNSTYIKVFFNNRTAIHWKKSGVCANSNFFNACRLIKVFVFHSLVNPGHNLAPQILVEVPGIIGKLLISVIAGPYSTCVVWSISYKPEVIVIFCSTCFTCNSHIIQLACGTSTILHNIFHSACKKEGSAFFDYRTSGRVVLNQHISIMIQDLGVVNWFDIGSVIGDGCIGSTQFYVGNTIGKASKCSRQVGICINIAVCIGIGLCSMCQGGKSEIVQILQSKFRSNILQTLYCNCIDRIADGSADSNSTAEGITCIIDRCTIGIGDWLVFISSGQ